jgi:hypothetical protein
LNGAAIGSSGRAAELTFGDLRNASPDPREPLMRAEAESLVESIKQSMGLLRRHL